MNIENSPNFIANKPDFIIDNKKTGAFKAIKQNLTNLTDLSHSIFGSSLRANIYGTKQERIDIDEDLRQELRGYGIPTDAIIQTHDGQKLEVLKLEAKDPNSGASLNNPETVIICTGSRDSYEKQGVPIAKAFLDQAVNVVLYNGRGFGKSTGSPNELGSYIDVNAVYQYVKSTTGGPPLDNDKILVYGYSLGGGAAVDLASKNPGVHLIGDRIWVKASDIAKEGVENKALANLVGKVMDKYYSYDNLGKIKEIRGKVLLASAQKDEAMGPEVYRALANAYDSSNKATGDVALRAQPNVEHLHYSKGSKKPEEEERDYLWFGEHSTDDNQDKITVFLNYIWPSRNKPSKTT